MQILRLKNYLLFEDYIQVEKIPATIQDYLFGLELSGKASWDRTKFINKFLGEDIKRLIDARKEIFEKNAKRNKDGKILFLDGKTKKEITEPKQGTSYQFEDAKKLAKDLDELLNDEVIIDITPANSGLIANLSRAMEEDKTTYSNMDSVRLAQYFEAMEPVGAELKKEEK